MIGSPPQGKNVFDNYFLYCLFYAYIRRWHSEHIAGRKITDKVAATGRALQEEVAKPNTTTFSGFIWDAVDRALLRYCVALEDDPMNQMPSQFKTYYSNPVVDRRTNPNPLETWHSMRTGLDHVFDVAMEYLPIPATSVASERLFSHAGCVATQRRCRLSPEHLGQLTFLRSVEKSMWFGAATPWNKTKGDCWESKQHGDSPTFKREVYSFL